MKDWILSRVADIRSHRGVVTTLFAIVVYVVLLAFADVSEVLHILVDTSYAQIATILVFASVAYIVRFLRWEYYIRSLGFNVPLIASIVVFFSGLMMSITPGKVGEVWKAWFLRDLQGVDVTPTTSIVITERVTDVLALSGFALLGTMMFGRTSVVPLAVGCLLIIGILLLQWRAFWEEIINRLQSVSVIRNYAEQIQSFYEATYALFLFKPLSFGVAAGILAWGLEAVAFWIILQGFGIDILLSRTLFVYGVGILIGAISTLPGGLGTTEASMTGLLLAFGYSEALAVSAVLLIRAGTLWYGTALGACVFGFHKVLRRYPFYTY
jgi:uncharacterized protein (TIRG00374 family)